MKKLLINAPIYSNSGYGNMARFALDVLKDYQDKFDLYVNVLSWGQTGWMHDETEEYQLIKAFRVKTEQYIQASGGKPQFDISLQITIPNEWKRMAPTNIGYTAGIETTNISPTWLEPSQMMDRIITISNFSRDVFLNTTFQDQAGNQHKVTTPIEVVHFPVREMSAKPLDLELPSQFNFLTINQWGPRKNMELLISSFIEEFRNEDVGLLIKTNQANDSQIDRDRVEGSLKALIASKGEKKCRIHLVHGRLTSEEMDGLYSHPKIKAFVTATHGEGFGMPIFEAVNAKLPIVATDWSGHLDFLSIDDKKMFAKVDFDLKQIEPQHVWQGVMEANSGWAFPTVASLRARMREVYKDYGRFKSWASKLADYNKEKFNRQKVQEDFFYALGLYSRPRVIEPKLINGISFCIPTHGQRIDKTLKTIKSIQKQNWNDIPYEIIVAGDVEKFNDIQGINIIPLKNEAQTRKVAILRNSAASLAKYENIVFCDDDIILDPQWLTDTINYSKNNGWDVLGNKVLSPDGTRYWDRATLTPHILVDYDYESSDKQLYQSSAFFIVRKQTFKNVKWDETKLVFADREGGVPEDVQYSRDLIKNSYILSFNKNALVWHNDDKYTEFYSSNYSQTLTKQILKENFNYQFFLPEDDEFIKLLDSLNE